MSNTRSRRRTTIVAAAVTTSALAALSGGGAHAAGEPPTASDGTGTLKAGQTVEVSLDAFDPDGEALAFTIVDAPDLGSLTDCAMGFCTYTAPNGYDGIDTFSFAASDGDLTSNVATYQIDVLGSTLTAAPLADAAGAADLAASLAGSGVSISNVTFTGDPSSAGTFDGGGPGLGVDRGVVLSSGRAVDVVGPNLDDGTSSSPMTAGDADLEALAGVATNDAVVLEFDLVPATGQLVFDYVFASEEYNEFVNSAFNDVFGFFVNGTNCATVNGKAVSINNVNNGNPYGTEPRSNFQYFVNNDLQDGGGGLDTEMDGMTVRLTCSADVTPGATNHVKLAIADGSDTSLDSAVFLVQGSFESNTAPSADGQAVMTDQGVPVAITLTGADPDGDPLTYEVTSGPSHGSLSGAGADLTYTPNAGYSGSDSFTFVTADGALSSPPATVTITVHPAAVNEPPTVGAGAPGAGVEGGPVTLAGTAIDPEGDALTLSWSATPQAGVDAGATCTFSAAAAAVTDITCTDDGVYDVTLTANDASHDPVTATTTVTLTNADPTVDITGPADLSSHAVGGAVSIVADLGDAGANDTHDCQIDWGDGTMTAGTVAGGGCTASHAYGSIGIPTITVTVSDDDGASATDAISVIVTAPSAKVTGGGWFDQGGRVSFGLVAEALGGGANGQVQVRIHNSARLHGTVETMTVNGTTATLTGAGRWNGESGARFDMVVVDAGNGNSKKSAGVDSITITIRDSAGGVLFEGSGALGGGNVKIH